MRIAPASHVLSSGVARCVHHHPRMFGSRPNVRCSRTACAGCGDPHGRTDWLVHCVGSFGSASRGFAHRSHRARRWNRGRLGRRPHCETARPRAIAVARRHPRCVASSAARQSDRRNDRHSGDSPPSARRLHRDARALAARSAVAHHRQSRGLRAPRGRHGVAEALAPSRAGRARANLAHCGVGSPRGPARRCPPSARVAPRSRSDVIDSLGRRRGPCRRSGPAGRRTHDAPFARRGTCASRAGQSHDLALGNVLGPRALAGSRSRSAENRGPPGGPRPAPRAPPWIGARAARSLCTQARQDGDARTLQPRRASVHRGARTPWQPGRTGQPAHSTPE